MAVLAKLAQEGQVNPTAQQSLDELAAKMSKAELERANKFVSNYKPAPTLLTTKAKNGITIAQELVEMAK